MGGATKGYISYDLIGRKRMIKAPPTPYFYMVDGTYSQSGLGITGAKPVDDDYIMKRLESHAKDSGV